MDTSRDERTEIGPAEAAHLTFLRRLVTALTVVMIGGLVVLIGLFVTRFPSLSAQPTQVPFDLPETITLPDGIRPLAFTRGPDWVAITSAREILIYDAESGDLRQRVAID